MSDQHIIKAAARIQDAVDAFSVAIDGMDDPDQKLEALRFRDCLERLEFAAVRLAAGEKQNITLEIWKPLP